MGSKTMAAVSETPSQILSGDARRETAKLLYICDFPPSNLGGGPILMSRLLREYPADSIKVLTSSRYLRVSPKEGRLACAHIAFPTTKGWGRWGLGRVRTVVDWLMIPVLVLFAVCIIVRQRANAIITIAHGKFFIGAALAGWLTGTPYIVMMHDDTVTPIERQSRLLKCVLGFSFRFALRGAAHVYAIGTEMQQLLKSEYGVDSELQRPATDTNRERGVAVAKCASPSQSPCILYAGGITDAVEDSLKLLCDLLVSGKLRTCANVPVELHLYTKLSSETVKDRGWNDPAISVHGWVPQEDLPRILQEADILFLPYSFSENVRYAVESAFPSKTADYLAAGKPILVFGPAYSSLVQYASEQGFAEIVQEFNTEALARGVSNIIDSPSRQRELSDRSLAVFSRNHDVNRQRANLHELLERLMSAKSS